MIPFPIILTSMSCRKVGIASGATRDEYIYRQSDATMYRAYNDDDNNKEAMPIEAHYINGLDCSQVYYGLKEIILAYRRGA